MNLEPFEDAHLLLAGARRHIQTFEERLTSLRKTNWVKPTFERTEDGGAAVKVKSDALIPPEFKQIAFDILGNLRSALDNAVYASATLIRGEELPSGTKFPFGDDEKDVLGDAKRRCRNVPTEILDLVIAVQPHKKGNPHLWALNKLRNTKSHRFLIPHIGSTSFVGASEPTLGAQRTYNWDPEAQTLRNTIELAEGVDLGAAAYVFRLELLIGTGTFRDEPALTIFNRMYSEVQMVVSAIEGETSRILRDV